METSIAILEGLGEEAGAPAKTVSRGLAIGLAAVAGLLGYLLGSRARTAPGAR